MTKPNIRSFLVGLLAGIAAALLSVGAAAQSAVSLFLLFVSAIPVMLAGIGWGSLAGAVAAATAFVIVAAATSLLGGLFVAVTTMIPAAWIAHLTNLARPADEVGGPRDAMVWYPLADIMFHLALALSVGFIAIGVSAGYGREMIAPLVDQILANLQTQSPEFQFDEAQQAAFVGTITRLLPALNPAFWFLILLFCHTVATAIARASGRTERPADDRATALRMPARGLIAFGAGLVLSFLPGGIGHIGAVLAGTFGAGFTVAGFALLHARSRGKPWRFIALWTAYLSVFLFTLPALFFLVAGLFDTTRSSPLTRGGPPSKT